MKPDGEFEPEQLEQFIDHLKSGKVQPYMRSMAVPKKQETLVKKIVANNYDTEMHKVNKSWGQSYEDFYTLGQIYKCILKHENGILTQIFFGHNIKIINPNIFIKLHFSLMWNGRFRHFLLRHPKV